MNKEPMTYIHDGMELPVENWNEANHSFDDLAGIIRNTHDAAQTSAITVCRRCATGSSATTSWNLNSMVRTEQSMALAY